MIFHKNIVVCEEGMCQDNRVFSRGSLLLFYLAPAVVTIRVAGDIKILAGKFCKARIAYCTPILLRSTTTNGNFYFFADHAHHVFSVNDRLVASWSGLHPIRFYFSCSLCPHTNKLLAVGTGDLPANSDDVSLFRRSLCRTRG